MLLHRDVKPENVLLDEAGNAYLVDFGLAGEAASAGEPVLLGGTAAYLAPERCRGEPALPASDLYALACLAYVLLTGDPPFPSEHEAALLYAHLREEPPSLAERGLSRLDPVLRRRSPRTRASARESCSAFAEELASALARPEPSGLESWPESLPRPATRLVGRARELAELEALLLRPETRLITLTGPGGTGKTRLALHAAAECASSFADGARFVSLAPLRDPAHALPAIAHALDVSEQPGTPLRDTLAGELAGRELLLVLDNAEHLLPALADDLALLRDVPGGPTLLVTSRERIDLQQEQLYPVPALAEAEGIELFCERARLADPAFDPADENVPALCQRLDSLPLALELAAARSDLYSPAELLRALHGHLELLTGSREHDPRHHTLLATIAWSYDLLTPEEQRAFRSLSVFAGGSTAEAAAAVADADLPLLHSLLSKSLLRTREASSARRYWMLETIREYSASRLEQAGEGEGARERHAASYAAFAVANESPLQGQGKTEALDALREEDENLRVALAHDRESAPARAIDLISALFQYWWHIGGLTEADRLLRELLEREPAPELAPKQRARALAAAGAFAWSLGDNVQALTTARREYRALPCARRARAARDGAAAARQCRGDLGDLDAAEASYAESGELRRSLGDTAAYARTLDNRVWAAFQKRDLELARRLTEEGLLLKREAGSPVDVATSLANLSGIAIAQGDVAAARACATEGLELLADHESRLVGLHLRVRLAESEIADGRLGEAREQLAVALDEWTALARDRELVFLLVPLAEYCSHIDHATAARLLGCDDSLRASIQYPRDWIDLDRYERLVREVTANIGDEEAERALAEGARLSREETIACLQDVLASAVHELISDRASDAEEPRRGGALPAVRGSECQRRIANASTSKRGRAAVPSTTILIVCVVAWSKLHQNTVFIPVVADACRSAYP